jgi:hypothetical protein
MLVGVRRRPSAVVLGPRGHSSMVGVGFHGRSWVLVNRGGGPPWLIVRGPGGPPSPSASGGAGSTWTERVESGLFKSYIEHRQVERFVIMHQHSCLSQLTPSASNSTAFSCLSPSSSST